MTPRPCCPDEHSVRPPGLYLVDKEWIGCPPVECQFCGSAELNLAFYGYNYAHCRACHRMSVPVSAVTCWAAMKIVRDKAGNAQTWDPLSEDVARLVAAVGDAREVELLDLTHAEALALRALTLRDRSTARALESLRAWAAAACDDVAP